MDLKGKIAVIAGATGEIGRELVKRLDEEGSKLILISKTESELQNLIKSLKNSDHSYYVCDFTNQVEMVKISKQISETYEKVDLLINASGIGIYESIEEAEIEDWNKSMDINVTSNLIFIKNLNRNLQNSENSLVLTIGSGAGVIPMAGRSVYCATKFALRGLILSLAEEFKRTKKPKFCLITLGSTLTSFGPMSMEEKVKESENGKAYFTVDWVGEKLLEIIKNDDRELEYKLYPGDYGFGSWSPPEPK